MSRKGENIYKRTDGRWEARYIRARTPDGKALYGYVYAKTYREVRQKALQKKRDIIEEIPISDIPLLEQLAEDWLKSVEIYLKPSTIVKYKNILKNHILPRLGKFYLNELDTECMEQFIQQILLCGRKDGRGGLSPKSTKDILSVVDGILEFASKKGFLVSCHINKPQVKVPEKPLEIISSREQCLLEEYLIKCNTRKSIGIMISLYMGLRIGEICALRWENINLEDGIITIRHTMQRIQNFLPDAKKKTDVIITQPKSDSSIRDIPIPAFLISLLEMHRESDKNAFFLTGKADVFIEPRAYQYFFKKTLKEAGVSETNYHVLRHTFATRCVERGFDTKSLSSILGHSTVNLTLNRYVHTSLEMKRKNMLKMAEPLCYSPSKF